jgi:hypothetical protein
MSLEVVDLFLGENYNFLTAPPSSTKSHNAESRE